MPSFKKWQVGGTNVDPLTTIVNFAGMTMSQSGDVTTITNTGDISSVTAGTGLSGGGSSGAVTVSQASIASNTFWTGNVGIALATAGNDTACDNGSIWWCALWAPYPTTISGIGYLIGSVGGTDKAIVGLYSSAGALLANSALAGTTVGTAANFQPLDFTAAYTAAPGLYFAAVQFNGATAKFRTHTAPGLKFVASNVAGTFGTLASITPGTTFTANKGPIAFTY